MNQIANLVLTFLLCSLVGLVLGYIHLNTRLLRSIFFEPLALMLTAAYVALGVLHPIGFVGFWFSYRLYLYINIKFSQSRKKH